MRDDELDGREAAERSSEGEAGRRKNISIHLRVRPSTETLQSVSVDEDLRTVRINVLKNADQGYINNQKELFTFTFDGIFTADSQQDQVFDSLAKELLLGALEGVNATIFAYGQTGSGKTFTITGGPERYADRGLIPRSIAFLFQSITQRRTSLYKVCVSFLEIYNEAGYDLLAPALAARVVEDLPRVHIMEDDGGQLHMRNLSLHPVASEEEALNLLFLGETNRTISDTPMNAASSRSHCIFTLHIESRQVGQEVVRRAKVHLVDLAGSERVSKTRVAGTVLSEAKHINLSLHFLEQVIISLQERETAQGRAHIPFRNSMLTTALRDSLGGNCQTVMVANVAATSDQAEESISTCRFAQRVAMISNMVTANEEVDPAVLIRLLKQEVADLREELRILKASQGVEEGCSAAQHYGDLHAATAAYLSDPSPEAQFKAGSSMRLIRAAMEMMKTMINKQASAGLSQAVNSSTPTGSPTASGDTLRQLAEPQRQVQQRDTEISVLLGMLRTHSKGAQQVTGQPAYDLCLNEQASMAVPVPAGHAVDVTPTQLSAVNGALQHGSVPDVAQSPPASTLADRDSALRYWEEHCFNGSGLQENRRLLRQHYHEAKSLGDQLDSGKETITRLRAQLQELMMRQDEDTIQANRTIDNIESVKESIWKETNDHSAALERLRELKPAIEHLQLLIERSQRARTAAFDVWHALALKISLQA